MARLINFAEKPGKYVKTACYHLHVATI